MKLSRKIASDYLRSRGATLPQHRFDDLCSFLVEHALRAANRYDPDRVQRTYGSNGGDPFASWLADILEQRCTDWYRSRAEGNGDRRYNNDKREVLSAMEDDPADHDVDFSKIVSDRERADWQAAAQATGWELDEWMKIALNKAAKSVLRTAA